MQGNQFKALGNGLGLLYIHAEHTKVTYRNNQEIHTFFDRFGNQKNGWGVWQQVYTKDDKGRYTRLEFFDKHGNAIQNSWGIESYQWQHQMDGSIIESRYNSKDELQPHRPGFQFERIRMIFGPSGHLRVMQNVDENGRMIASKSGAAQYHYYYDTMGKFLRWEIYDAMGKPAIGPTQTAGEFYTNHPTDFKKITFFDQSGALTKHASGAVHWMIKNDQYGNMISRSFLGENDEPVNGRYNFHKLVQIWDDQGIHPREKRLIDFSGNAATHIDGYSSTTYFYDDNGLLIEQRFLDAEGKLVFNSYDKAAIIRHTYNEKGERVKTQHYHADGTPVES
ncbi:hypothetical protein [Kordiimonas sp. SCSIO 12610]|uniref:hypothetical protein n=1 Tax=Kordiimonas sp. SCSIO 12610 TaxID=2829597 RepID=UPI00210A2A7C|nr:hypothetical protein [Kordiimonas sp. SCSIO 12610]UTW54664.1 hypothetical protein KFF44_12740 [Kordiimonas sp. SCSIO 12610]